MDETVDLVGYLASGLVLLTFAVRSITTLRVVAILSNLVFMAYGLIAGLPPVLLLHALLLPLNAWRLWETRAVRRTAPRTGRGSNLADTPDPRQR